MLKKTMTYSIYALIFLLILGLNIKILVLEDYIDNLSLSVSFSEKIRKVFLQRDRFLLNQISYSVVKSKELSETVEYQLALARADNEKLSKLYASMYFDIANGTGFIGGNGFATVSDDGEIEYKPDYAPGGG